MKISVENPSASPSGNIDDFDTQSGSLLERLLFNNRLVILAICALVTILLGLQLPNLALNASFEKMIPSSHPFIRNFLDNKGDLAGQGNVVRIIVETTKGTILDKDYLEALQHINDEVYLVPGVDRPFMMSLWTPSMRWVGVTEGGLEGGPVIDSHYNGSPASIETVRSHILNSGGVGEIVAPDFKSSMLLVPVLERDTQTGGRLNYGSFARHLDEIRQKYESDTIKIHIVGFAQIIGDLLQGLQQVLTFFAIALVVTMGMVYWYTRCVRSTALVVLCSLIAVMWLLGLLPVIGVELDPYSILVPFLVFAIGMSHGSQKMNGVMQDIGRGTHRLLAARFTFRRLFMAGFSALVCDAIGFAVLLIIKIDVIRELAEVASLGVAILVFTNLILLPILLSYTGVGKAAAERALRSEGSTAETVEERHPLWRFLDLFTRRNWAIGAIVVALLMGIGGWAVSLHLKVGDLDAGAPELRPDSRYNRDDAFLTAHYATGSDVLVVMIKTPEQECGNYDSLRRIDELEWQLRQLDGVAATSSLAGFVRQMTREMTEDNAKWYDLIPSQEIINNQLQYAPREIANHACGLSMLRVFLTDHRADTLTRVVDTANRYIAGNNTDKTQFMLLAGNAGIEAATNIVVKEASDDMLYWVYGAVIILCLITFRSWRAVICAVLPLILTSILAEALMVWLGIGVKVATLPVIALGVGIGVDYALYVLSIVLIYLRSGASLSDAYYRALCFTGRVVLLTGFTLAIGVATWVYSPIKFQADMGILLAFCFLWNMLGSLVLLPALAALLLVPRARTVTKVAAVV